MTISLPEPPATLPRQNRADWRYALRHWLRLGWALDSAYWNVTDWHIDAREALGEEPGKRWDGKRRAYSAAEMSLQWHNVAVMQEHACARLGRP